MLLITQRITGGCNLKTYRRRDITSINSLQISAAVVCVHLQNTSQTLLLALSGVAVRKNQHSQYRNIPGRKPAYLRKDPP